MSKEKSGVTIYYHDIGDYLSREQKLDIIRKARSINGVKWTELHPDEHGDWINHRNGKFAEFIPLGDKDDKKNCCNKIFNAVHTNGLKTQRDAWCYNFAEQQVAGNMQRMIEFYNQQRLVYQSQKKFNVLDFVSSDERKISWSRSLRNGTGNDPLTFEQGKIPVDRRQGNVRLLLLEQLVQSLGAGVGVGSAEAGKDGVAFAKLLCRFHYT